MDSNSALIKSIQTLLRILEFMKDEESVTIKQCADELDLANSTIHKHLATVKDARLVIQDGDEYRLGLGFLEYGHIAKNRLRVVELAEARLKDLAETTDERVWLKVEEHGIEVPIAVCSGKHAINTDRDIGQPNKMNTTAGGKAILAHLPERRREEIIENQGLASKTEHSIVDPDELRAELAEIREKGVAYNKSEDIVGVNAVASPIIDHDGTAHGSVVIAGPARRLGDEWLKGELTELVVGTTNELGINLSYQQ
jgi:DNA-binding IclR family transcriptional regulator